MIEFPASARLDRVLDSGGLRPEHIDALAAELAEFHGRVAVAEENSPYRSVPRFYQPIERNLASIQQLVAAAHALPAPQGAIATEVRDCLASLAPWARGEFDRRATIFAARAAGGWIRECHGDLHLANMLLLGDRVTLFDCLEFSAELRWIDVLNELAFAVMDLARRWRDDFSRRLTNAYLEITGDYAGLPIFRFYLTYRALVRANVALLRRAQAGVDPTADLSLWQECRDYLQLALRYTTPATPRLLLTGGLSGSGKTTGSGLLLQAMDAVRLRSDVERKRLFKGQDAGMYSAHANRLTYDRLAELARPIIAAGFTPLIDATFLRRADRDGFRTLAAELGVPFAILQFTASEELLRDRIRRRWATGQDASDANIAVLKGQLRTQEALGDDELSATVTIDADRPSDLEQLLEKIAEKACVPGLDPMS
jgi:hypothetical protein